MGDSARCEDWIEGRCYTSVMPTSSLTSTSTSTTTSSIVAFGGPPSAFGSIVVKVLGER